MASIINALSSGTGGIVTAGDASGILQLQTANTAAVTIDGSQNVGIGTASPGQKLTVAGSTSLGTASASGNLALYQAPGSLFLTMNTNGTLAGARRNWAISPEYDVAGALSFGVGTSEGATPTSPRLIIKNQGAVILSGGSTSADGTGITFPATQSASSDANTLDDYEEGTWTPTIKFGGNSAGQTYGTRSATYVKVGQMVLVQMNVGFTNKGSSTGTAKITGLPFTQNDTTYPTGTFAADGGFSGISSNGFGIYGLLAGNEVYIRYNGSSGGYADLYDTNFSNTSAFYYSLVYRASA
jgi:hypothetical protein